MPDTASQSFTLLLAHGGKETTVAAQTPFTIGRSPQMDLVLPYPYISRHHAEIQFEPASQHLELVAISSECFVNGARVTRHTLVPGDQIRLGFPQGPLLVLPDRSTSRPSLRATLDHLKEPSTSDGDLTKLTWFVEAARRLNNVGAVQEILSALIDTTLELTRVERGYVFLRNPAGELTLAAGRSHNAEVLADSATLSHTAIRQAIESGSEFIVTDTLSAEAAQPTESIVVQNIRAIICIPLRKRSPEGDSGESRVLGVLYLDSRQQRSRLTRMDNELLRTIATEATLLVENATLAQAEAAARRYREELLIASEIQQGLMLVTIPCLAFANVDAQSIPCKGIGGDFYDVLCHNDDLYIVVADISGKGVSAAVLGSTLQGLIHGQILSGLSLSDIALFANQYICRKNIRKYATLLILRLAPDGTAEYVNCGHVQPMLHAPADDSSQGPLIASIGGNNLPVGLFAEAVYASESLRLEPGQRILILTDGFTEAEDPSGHCFGDGPLQSLVAGGSSLSQIFAGLKAFTAGAELEDDCTMVEIRYRSA
ncbi:MAG TPA: SpoIIE family protein phosphatase [Acidobacteriaceae bacterium]|nr:SpoIIE family protein phosphatase [Acidobacteriaceae bacterium]